MSWAVTKYPQWQSRITNQQVDQTVEMALQMWSNVSNLRFQRVETDNPNIDIDIRFEVKKHGEDDVPFDGKGGDLIHAYSPQRGGDIFLDDEEDWTLNTEEV